MTKYVVCELYFDIDEVDGLFSCDEGCNIHGDPSIIPTLYNSKEEALKGIKELVNRYETEKDEDESFFYDDEDGDRILYHTPSNDEEADPDWGILYTIWPVSETAEEV